MTEKADAVYHHTELAGRLWSAVKLVVHAVAPDALAVESIVEAKQSRFGMDAVGGVACDTL